MNTEHVTPEQLRDAAEFHKVSPAITVEYRVSIPELLIDELAAMGHDDAPTRAAKNVVEQQFADDHEFELAVPTVTAQEVQALDSENREFRVVVTV